jgi:uncharacterized protein YcaQ
MIALVSSIALSLPEARRVAVLGAGLAEPRARSIMDVVERLGRVQMDPTNAVARTEYLVLWSRLGRYDVDELRRLLWEERRLFEFWAFIAPTSDYAIHRETMRRFPRGDHVRARYSREWLAANAGFRRYVLRELRRRGPLLSRDLEDRAEVPWRTGGWNDGKSLGRMLDQLWSGGEIAIVGRQGNQRVWDLAERWLPTDAPRLSEREVARRLLDTQLRWCGFARRDRFGFAFDGAPPGREKALDELVAEGRFVPVTVDGTAGEWLAHADVLEEDFRPRTTLLSPFDPLIKDRDFTEEIFGFRYRLEIYVPKAKREYGYFVLPILHGDRLIGRIDPLFDRKAGVLRVNTVYAEPDAPEEAGPGVVAAIHELADWLGADVDFGVVAPQWEAACAAYA